MSGTTPHKLINSSSSSRSLGSPRGGSGKSSGECVRVAVRVRPFNERELALGSTSVISMYGAATAIEDVENERAKHEYTYDYSFDSSQPASPAFASQEDVFEALGRPLIEHAWSGFNCSMFAYGQTGSGKSYTMMGYGEAKGLIPRGCEALFERLAAAEADAQVSGASVEVSYLEIYNENIRDLLSPRLGATRTLSGLQRVESPGAHRAGEHSGSHLTIRENPQLGVYVVGLSKILVKSYADIEKAINAGNRSRTVARTKMNDTSSRSHSVFTIYFSKEAETSIGSESTFSKISLIDLAGSERQKHTQAQGERLKEACSINKSLSALGNVISVLADNSHRPRRQHKYVPYRDSALTRLLQESLGGNSKTVMIATVSPAADNFDESLSTLKYAHRAKQIVNSARKNEEVKAAAVDALQAEVLRLKELLAASSGGGGTGTAASPQDRLAQEEAASRLAENEALIAELSMTVAEKERRTEEINRLRSEALADMGISMVELTGALGVDKSTPHLVNLNADPLMSENLVYFLNDNVTRIGKATASVPQDIVLSGFNIQDEHCTIEAAADGSMILHPAANAKTFVNGEQVTEPAVLATGHRIILGNNYLFRYTNPAELEQLLAESDGKLPPELAGGFEFAMREFLAARGQSVDVDPDSEAGLILRLVEATDEANDVAELLKKKMIFSVELHDNDDGKREVGIRATNLLTDSTKFWSVEKFDNRFAAIQQYMEIYGQTGSWDVPAEDDPFFDPPSDQLIGTATVALGPLLSHGVIDGWFPATFGRFDEARGEVHLRLSVVAAPLDSTPSPVLLAQAKPLLITKDTIGSLVAVNISVAGIREVTCEFDEGMFVRFFFPEGSEEVTPRTEAVSLQESVSSKRASETPLAYFESFVMPLSKSLVAQLGTGSLKFELWGHDSLEARDPDVLQAVLRTRDAELEAARRNFADINAKQADEIAALKARVAELESNAYTVLKDEVNEFRAKKAKFEATLRTLHDTLPAFESQLNSMMASASASAAGVGTPPRTPRKLTPRELSQPFLGH
ncbi:kinesin family member 1B [Thecamonas trahens ATCC 50062]|uniref:Kinesin family member 1B n=1 Tax=Thecamonas trahens ATCC 50062 TaxID=461836 RepID=A0A0L0DMX9_THETB|nr:kinesin family member 1B [Thecamonas trahens ATCC 50062]KNC53662.1 kinesin family member 1B [Thecamonas trahens ATCC 50062]|eukprot:XP_013761977.1 kinesin family member 1B [Thecamonas trahens ATCC 50062]